MIIGGFQSCSFSDYPGRVASVIFTKGCNFRCRYCHNPSLLSTARSGSGLDIDMIFDSLKKRISAVESVVVTGGEPTIHLDLPDLLRTLRTIGLKIKLDTSGCSPQMLQHLISENIVDFIAMDIKAPLGKYHLVAGVEIALDSILDSIDIIAQSGLEHQFRTTFDPALLGENDLKIIQTLVPNGSSYKVQLCRAPLSVR